MPRFGVAAGAIAAQTGLCRAFRVGLFDPAGRRCRADRRAKGRHAGCRRPARLGGGLCAGRRLGGAGRDQRHVRGRGAYPALRDAALQVRRTDQRHGRTRRSRFRICDECVAHCRSRADHQAFHRQPLGRGDGARRTSRCRPEAPRCAPNHRGRADLRGGRWRRCGRMEWRCGGTNQGGLCRPADPQAARDLRAGRSAASWPGQMVSGRKPAALGLCGLLAQGWHADLARRKPDRARRCARWRAHGDARRRPRFPEPYGREYGLYRRLYPCGL